MPTSSRADGHLHRASTAKAKMTIRTLTAPEYSRLAAIADGIIPSPDDSIVIIAENESGDIIGRMFLVDVPHIEGTWVADSERGGTVGFRLERAMCKAAAGLRLKKTFAFVTTAEHANYLLRLGWEPTEYRVMTKSLEKES